MPRVWSNKAANAIETFENKLSEDGKRITQAA